jgi:hypothetical protein
MGTSTSLTGCAFFSGTNETATYTVQLHDNEQKCFFVVLDKKLHNDGSDDCPYLVFAFSRDYKARKMTEGGVIDVVDVIYR